MQIAPEAKPLLLTQKEAIASANPLTEQAVTPTVIGQRLAKKLGLEKVSSRAINKKLLQLGYQIKETNADRETDVSSDSDLSMVIQLLPTNLFI